MEKIQIQRSDWDALEGRWQELVRASFHPNFIGMMEAYTGINDAERIIAQMQHYIEGLPVWAAWYEGQFAGLLSGKMDGDRLALYDLYIFPQFQRLGIGRSLVQFAIRDSHARIITAEVNRANTASQGLFQSLDFQRELTADWFVLRLE